MRRLLLLCLLPFALCNATWAQNKAVGIRSELVPEFPKKLVKRYAAYKDFYAANLISWSNDGKLMISADIGGGVQVCTLDTTDTAPHPITKFSEQPQSIKPGPRSHHGYIFRKGNKWQYFFYNSHRRKSKALTSPSERAMGSCSGNEKFAFASNRRTNRDYDIYTTTVSDPDTSVLVYMGKGQWMPLAFSPDESKLLLVHYPERLFSHIYILDIASGKVKKITDDEKQVRYNHNAVFTKDGKRVLYSGDDFWVYDLVTESTSNLSAGGVGKVTAFAEAASSTNYVYATEDEKGGSLHILDKIGKVTKKIPLPKGASVTNLIFSPKELKIAAGLKSSRAPNRVATYSISDDMWTEHTFKTGEISSKFVSARMIKYPTFDTEKGSPRKISAKYFQSSTEGKHPVYIILHSELGHHGHSDFDPFIQYLINELNMSVVIPNFRGSSGFGKAFSDLDNGFKKRDVIKDIGMLLSWIEAQEELDPEKVVVSGISEGGRLAMSVLARYDDKLIAGIAGAGMYDLEKHFTTLSPDKAKAVKKEFGDWDKPEVKSFLRDLSPIHSVDQITKPIFLFHSDKDKVVSSKQTVKFKEALKKGGNQPWFIGVPGNRHFEWQPEKQRYLDHAKLVFIEMALKAKKK